MFYVTKKPNLISDSDFKKIQHLSGKCVSYSIKIMGSFGRRKKYYTLRLLRIKRDRDRILSNNKTVWEKVTNREEKTS